MSSKMTRVNIILSCELGIKLGIAFNALSNGGNILDVETLNS